MPAQQLEPALSRETQTPQVLMTSDNDSMVFLTGCDNAIHAASIRSVLEANGIRVFVQGENHASMMGHNQLLIEPRILVPLGQLEVARGLLAALPIQHLDTVGPKDFAGGLCPVHEASAVGSCDRCGSSLCSNCVVMGDPPLCESCTAIETKPVAARAELRLKRYNRFLLAAGFLTVGMAFLGAVRSCQAP